MKTVDDQHIINILIIEDNPGDQLLINEELSNSTNDTFNLSYCSSLSEGFDLLKKEKFHVIILDLWLPDSSGLETLKSICLLDNTIPVIVLTIDNSDETGLLAINYGAQDYLSKDELYERNLSKSIRYAISRKELELKLKETLNVYESTFEQASVGFAHITKDGLFIKLNNKFSEILGYSIEDLVGKSIFDIILSEDNENGQISFNCLLSGEIKTQLLEKLFIHKNGSLLWINVSGTAIFNDKNEVKYFFLTIEDITGKKNLEIDLRQHKEMLESVFKVLPVGVCIMNSEGDLVINNKKFEEIWFGAGYFDIKDHYKYKGWRAGMNKEISSDEWPSYRALKYKEVSIGEIINIECFDGTKKTIINSAIPLVSNGNVAYVVVVIEDITHLLETESKLRELIAEKEMLIKEADHRIKNNLQLISSFINMQLSNVEDVKEKNILQDSMNRISSISRLHDYLHRSARFNEVDIQNYLYDIIEHITATLRTDPAGIRIIKDIDSIMLNSGLAISIGLIINEIITNAIKYAFEGKECGIISLKLKQVNKEITLIMEDDGIGIRGDIKLENCSTLGLQIIYSLVTQHNGTINYEVNNGTKFIIKLPIQ